MGGGDVFGGGLRVAVDFVCGFRARAGVVWWGNSGCLVCGQEIV